MGVQNESLEIPSWVRGAIWVVGLIVPLFVSGMGIIGWLYRDHTDKSLANLDHRLVQNETVCEAFRELALKNSESIEHHTSECDDWHERIRQNENRILGVLTDTKARPDPFTGTEGRQLEKRIYDLERRYDDFIRALERHEERLHEHVTAAQPQAEHQRQFRNRGTQ